MSRPTNPVPEDLEAVLRASRALEDAPEDAIQRAIGLWKERAPAVEGEAGWIERLVATLGFDSAGAAPLAHGLRSAGADVRQMLFTAGERDIDLRLAPSEGAPLWRVSGQILGPDANGEAVLRADGFAARTPWNELSEFAFDAVPAGRYRLMLYSAKWEIELPPFDLLPLRG